MKKLRFTRTTNDALASGGPAVLSCNIIDIPGQDTKLEIQLNDSIKILDQAEAKQFRDWLIDHFGLPGDWDQFSQALEAADRLRHVEE